MRNKKTNRGGSAEQRSGDHVRLPRDPACSRNYEQHVVHRRLCPGSRSRARTRARQAEDDMAGGDEANLVAGMDVDDTLRLA